jgi:hypothetical protein
MSELATKVKSLLNLDRDKIISECNYKDENDDLDYVSFYENYCDAIKLSKISYRSDFLENFLRKERRRVTPMVESGLIYGGYTFFISDREGEAEWTEENWDYDDDENMNGPYEVGNPHASKGYYEGYFTYEEAIRVFARRDELFNL